MFTVCPKCSLKLVVTAADLRVAQGYVRCGRCSNVFNALVGLSDEQQAVLAREERAAAGAGPPAARPNVQAGPAAPAAPAAEPISDAALEFDPVATDVSEVFVEPQLDEDGSTGRSETIILRSEDAPREDAPHEDVPHEEVQREDVQRESAQHDDARPEDAPPAGARPDHTPPEGARLESTRPDHAPPEHAPPEHARPEGTAAEHARPAETAQLELDSTEFEKTDEFELADLESLLKGIGAQSAPAGGSVAQTDDVSRSPDAPDGSQALGSAQAPDASQTLDRSQALGSLQTPTSSQAPASSQISSGSHAVSSSQVSSVAGASDAPYAAERLDTPHDPSGSADDMLEPDSAAAPAPRGLDRALQLGSAVLVLILAAQIVHHYRDRLAHIDWLRPPLTAVYAILGMPLEPHWDVTAYEVRQLGAIAGPENPGALTVRASIKNTATRRQPLPLLRVTVQDRFGNRVAARDVPPDAYLPKTSAERSYLAAGQRVDAEIALVDPGPSVVGFEIDACLRDSSGRVSCANDTSDANGANGAR